MTRTQIAHECGTSTKDRGWTMSWYSRDGTATKWPRAGNGTVVPEEGCGLWTMSSQVPLPDGGGGVGNEHGGVVDLPRVGSWHGV